MAETPYLKLVFHLPTVLSQEEVAQLIDAARTPYHRNLLMTLFATGIRRSELTGACYSVFELKGELDQTRAARFGMLVDPFGTPWRSNDAAFEILNSKGYVFKVRAKNSNSAGLTQLKKDGRRRG